MLVAENILLKTVQQGLQQIAADPAPLQDLFNAEAPQDVSKLYAALADPTRPVAVLMGFPQGAIMVPTIALTLGVQEETDQYVGDGLDIDAFVLGSAIAGQTTAIRTSTTSLFQSTWRFTVYSPNSQFALYLAYIVKYILLAQRSFLDGLGFIEQRLSMGDFEPTPEYLPDLVYVRAVMLTAKLADSVGVSVPIEPFSDIDINIG